VAGCCERLLASQEGPCSVELVSQVNAVEPLLHVRALKECQPVSLEVISLVIIKRT
jgi:hypothetical protein